MDKKQTKRILNWGWVTAADRNIKNLNRLAAAGWVLDEAYTYSFRLKRGEPEQVEYAVDWPLDLRDEQEYLAIMQKTGWQLVHKYCGGKAPSIFLFKAPRGTVPPHTDKTLLKELNRRRIRAYAISTGLSLLLAIGLLSLLAAISPVPIIVRIIFAVFAVPIAAYLGISATTLVSLLFIKQKF